MRHLAGWVVVLLVMSPLAEAAASVCVAAPGGGTSQSALPSLSATLANRWREAWLGSPVVADLDADGVNEILATRANRVTAWHLDETIVYQVETPGARIFAPPVVADLDPMRAGLEVAAAAGDAIYVWDATGTLLPGFPVSWLYEIRALAAGDVDGDHALELVVVSTGYVEAGGQRDVAMAYEIDGQPVTGYPPNTSGTSGCDDRCYVFGGYGQTLALGDLDDDGADDLVVPHDNAYVSAHRGSGVMFDSASIFQWPTKFAGVRFLFDYAYAQQGWAPNELAENQNTHTSSAPALADIDGDGELEIVLLGATSNAALTDWERGVGLFVVETDGTRLLDWEAPYHAAAYLAGRWDLGSNLLSASNEVAVADVDPTSPGLEMVFAGFDGRIHAVASDRQLLWTFPYTTAVDVLTSGVVLADLSGDASPEVVFNTYSSGSNESDLFILGADGSLQHRLPLGGRGAMPVPTVADVDEDGDLEIIVSYKDAVDQVRQLEVYTVAGSTTNCLPWPTARGNYARTGAVPVPEPGLAIQLVAAGALFGRLARRRRPL